MALRDVTRSAVLEAIREYDDIGRDAFLKHYGFGKARDYILRYNGRSYDSKAIVGAAHGKLSPEHPLLSHRKFSGGERTVEKLLKGLGFDIGGETEPARGVVIPFERGRSYHRQRDIHQAYGGQERGGIATPQGVPYVFLFTGESGVRYGYEDGWQQDGTFARTGEGQVGDKVFERGNRAIRDHIGDGRDLVMFEARSQKGLYRYIGCFAGVGWNYQK
jgi:5-methylcytosine-specific restriction protein A